MKNIQTHSPGYKSAYFRFFFFSLCALCVLCVSISAQDFKTVRDGIEYAEVTREISGQQVKMNLLRLDLTKVRLDVVHAMDAAIGTEKTSSIATRHGAFAAINAGFFRLDNSIFAGDPAGILMINRRLISESVNDRIALVIRNEKNTTAVNFDKLRTSIVVHTQSGSKLPVDGVDRERKKGELVVFTREFGVSTLTNADGSEFSILMSGPENNQGRLVNVRNNEGSSTITADSFVISASEDKKDEVMKAAKKNGFRQWTLDIDVECVVDPKKCVELDNVEDIVGGVPQLIKDGKVDVTWQDEKSSKSFVETRHPRTAVAKLKDGKFLMITVDGRSESSGGIGLYDLADYLLELGAIDAMNLDGGGSSTMFLDGKVVNHPSDKEGERKVSDAILVFPRGKTN